MPRGASAKREREYEGLVEEFHDEGRYPGREEEVAARIVNKQRAEHSETTEAKAKDREGESPDRHLPIKEYDHLTVDEVTSKLGKLNNKEIERIRDYEKKHRARKTLLTELDRALKGN